MRIPLCHWKEERVRPCCSLGVILIARNRKHKERIGEEETRGRGRGRQKNGDRERERGEGKERERESEHIARRVMTTEAVIVNINRLGPKCHLTLMRRLISLCPQRHVLCCPSIGTPVMWCSSLKSNELEDFGRKRQRERGA
jgi:hypothetical protein